MYLVAAFAKKIARLSLSAPPDGEQVTIKFVLAPKRINSLLWWGCEVKRSFTSTDFCFLYNIGVVLAVVMVINLTKRHPNCRVLLHQAAATTTTCDDPPPEDGSHVTHGDPFDLYEADPAKCNALESSLWEFKVRL